MSCYSDCMLQTYETQYELASYRPLSPPLRYSLLIYHFGFTLAMSIVLTSKHFTDDMQISLSQFVEHDHM